MHGTEHTHWNGLVGTVRLNGTDRGTGWMEQAGIYGRNEAGRMEVSGFDWQKDGRTDH